MVTGLRCGRFMTATPDTLRPPVPVICRTEEILGMSFRTVSLRYSRHWASLIIVAKALKAWMRQISVNEALKFIRKRKRSDTVEYKWDLPDKEEEEEPDVGSVPPGVIQKMIQALPEGYRTVLNLYAFEEKSHKEIAALLGITESTSASQLHRARAILARQINEYKKRTETT